jgi:hypothetical protein
VLAAAVPRLDELAAFTQARADAGDDGVRSHVDLYRRDAAWIATHAGDLDPARSRPGPRRAGRG